MEGKALINSGPSRSFSPPEGDPLLAHCTNANKDKKIKISPVILRIIHRGNIQSQSKHFFYDDRNEKNSDLYASKF